MSNKSISHIVLFSGGLASFEVGRRVLKTFGSEIVKFWFFDTLIEDSGLYQFLDNSEKVLGIKIERLQDGRNPWQVFRDERYIGNSRAPLCNRVLKRELLEQQLQKQFPQKDIVLYLGYEWFETRRVEKARKRWTEKGYRVEFPLTNPPFLDKSKLIQNAELEGITIPTLYQLGFSHNNCGGACVQAGIKQWTRLLKEFPERYLWHEEQEQETRNYLQKDVAILRDRNGGFTRPLTLRELRLKVEKNRKVEQNLGPNKRSFSYMPLVSEEVYDD